MTEPTTPRGPQEPTSQPQGDPNAGGRVPEPTAPTPTVHPTTPIPVNPLSGSLPPQGPPQGPTYQGAAPQGPPPRPVKGPGLFRQATSTTGGLIAVIVAACLAALLVVVLAGAGLFVGARLLGHHADVVRVQQAGPGQLSPGQRKKLNGPMAPGMPGLRNGQGNGSRLGPLMGGAAGLGGVQHGEFTTQGANGAATVMTVQRGTVTAASATSLTVRSDDGFTATYAVDATTRGLSSGLAKGDVVLVVANKAGAKAVLIRAARTP